MPNPSPTHFRRILPAAASTFLVFLVFFLLPWILTLPGPGNERQVDFMILPPWITPVAMFLFCVLAIGLPIAFLTGYAEGKEQRIDTMLDRK